MLEKMYTTKMSADKEKLQIRFAKIRSKGGQTGRIFGGALFVVILLSIMVISVAVAVNTVNDYEMTDEEFSGYVQRNIGSIMAVPDYIDDDKFVFHYIDGFFVVDRQDNEILHKIGLNKLNIAGHTQGDCYTNFEIDKGGRYAYLTNDGNEESVKSFDSYIIDLETGDVEVGVKTDGTEIFADYGDTFASVKNTFGWASDRCITGESGKIYYLAAADSMISSIQLVIYNADTNDTTASYVFGTDYVSASLRKSDIIKSEALDGGEEILVNSGCQWEVNGDLVKAIIDKLNETRNLKHIDIKDGNYDVLLFDIWDNVDEENNLRIFIFDNYKTELVFFIDITLDEHKYIANLLNNPGIPEKELYPLDIKDITDAELMINGTVYPILVRSNMEKIEKMLSGAKIINGATDCPIKGILVLTNKDGEKGMVTLATDSCAVFVSNGSYYDYSEGDNSEMLGYFGIDSEKILDLTT